MNLLEKSAKLREAITDDRAASVCNVIQITTMLGWLALLLRTNAFYVTYLIVGICGLFCRHAISYKKCDIFSRSERIEAIPASFFSLAVIAANYDIYKSIVMSVASHSEVASEFLLNHLSIAQFGIFLFYFPVLFLGGMFNSYYILKYLSLKMTSFQWKSCGYKSNPRKFFFFVLIILGVFYSAIMLLCFYPGIISPDSENQLEEILNNSYSNRNPVFHTMLIRIFVKTGIGLFDSITFGTALYSLFSIVFLSSVFAYSSVTLYQLNINKKVIIASVLLYLLMPYHIIYSFTMWKDIPFSASVFLFIISLFRYFSKTGKNQMLNIILMLMGSCGICFFRGNGLIVFFVFLVVFAAMSGKTQRVICISFAGVFAAALIITYPVLNALNVKQSDSAELLTIPIQQISRSVVDGNDLTDSQKKLLSNIVDVDAIANRYDPLVVDPMKVLIREKNNEEYFKNHRLAFFKLYLELGVSHPGSFFTAWVDQTKGYWNAGYDQWRISYARLGKNIGVRHTTALKGLQKAVYAYAEMFEYVEVFQPFVSIGFYTWLLLLVLFVACKKKDRISIIITVPSLAIVFSMLLGSPVYSEFRYVYAVFCCLPFLAVVLFRPDMPHENYVKDEIILNNED